MARGVSAALPSSDIKLLPMGDGGEGTAEIVSLALHGEQHEVIALDANGKARTAHFYSCVNEELGRFGVFDVAALVGLPNAVVEPGARTTRGVGQMIQAIVKRGFKTVVIGLGGSSTNDAGAGMLSELGWEFRRADDGHMHPVYDTLGLVDSVRCLTESWQEGVRLIGLSDVSSPLCGKDGASFVFGGQKGFNNLGAADVRLQQFSAQCEGASCRAVAHLPGAGAAGGLGFALLLMGAEIIPGARFVLEATGTAHQLGSFDWVITGEGRSDRQTLMGKGPGLLAELARSTTTPVSLLSGAVAAEPDLWAAFDGCFSVQAEPVSLEQALGNAAPLLEAAAFNLARFFSSGARRN